MKKLWLLLVMVTPLQLIHAQQVHHAPTVAQCRADQRLWLDKLERVPVRSGIADVTYLELDKWFEEMFNCGKVDSDFNFEYLLTLSEVSQEQAIRLSNFLRRHNLQGQFLSEDAQDKR